MELWTEQVDQHKNKGDQCQNNQPLGSGSFLNWLSGFRITNLTRTVLRLILINQRIKFTSKANAKG